MKELTIDAHVENLNQVLAFIEEQLDGYGCSLKESTRIQIAVEELFVNIAQYAYDEDKGKVNIQIEHLDEKAAVRIILMDSGKPYNPLHHEDPDVTLDADERPIGGLGIFMVKKTMENMEYEFVDGHNCLTIVANI